MTADRDNLLAEALRFEKEGDQARAIACLEEIVRCYPKDVRTRTWLGRSYSDREQYAAAIEMLEHTLAIDDSYARTHAVLAEAYLALGHHHAGEIAALRSVELAKESTVFVLLGYALSAQARSPDAEMAFRRALEVEQDNEEAMFNLALELRRRDPSEALALLAAAIRVDPLYAAAYREYGFQLAEARDYRSAEDALRTSITLDRNDSLARVYLGNVLCASGQLSEAEQQLRQACAMSPLNALPHWGLAKLCEAGDRNAEAEMFFRLAATLEPEQPEALFQFARFLAGVGRLVEARDWLERTLVQDPTHEAALRLGRQLLSDEA